MDQQTRPILSELTAVERVLECERATHAATRKSLQAAKLRAREARTALAAEASAGGMHPGLRISCAMFRTGRMPPPKRCEGNAESLPPVVPCRRCTGLRRGAGAHGARRGFGGTAGGRECTGVKRCRTRATRRDGVAVLGVCAWCLVFERSLCGARHSGCHKGCGRGQ